MVDSASERQMRSVLEVERAILGLILMDAETADIAIDLVRPEHFCSTAHQRIFCRMAELHTKGTKIDLVTLIEALDRAGELEKVGGPASVSSLTDGVPIGGWGHLDEYARIVKEATLRRALINAARGITSQAAEGIEDPLTVLDRALESFTAIGAESFLAGDEGVTYREAALSHLASLERNDGVRVFTDVDEIDRLTGGFRSRELILVTADTGVGKTLFAQQIRRRACQDGLVSLYASCEMTAGHLVSRELATEAGVDHWKMRRPEAISPQEMCTLLETANHACEKCRILDGEITLSRIRSTGRRMKSTSGLDLVIVDYDELVSVPGQTELDQQRNLVIGCKNLAVVLSIPVILISQLRKSLQGEDRKRPTLQRIYGSGAKAKHASLVIYVDREYVRELKGDETAARICILKNRDGRVGKIDARFNVRTLRFESLGKSAA